MQPQRLIILGATGSIGRQTLEVAAEIPQWVRPVALAAASNWQVLAELADRAGVKKVALASEEAGEHLKAARPDLDVQAGPSAMTRLVEDMEADVVVVAIAGLAALEPMLAALRRGLRVAFASKEPIVAAGRLVTDAARRYVATLVPIDSEISAVFQCLQAVQRQWVEKIILTASGGPFSKLSKDQLSKVTAAEALRHPTWRMGPKVTIDSATLMNKGFEVFEMHWLFDVPVERIEVVIHHQSIIHSAIQLIDGSVLAQMSLPDMRLPIQYALTYPERAPNTFPRLSLPETGELTFAQPDTERFPCLRLAFEAAEAGGTYPAVLNAADEVAVQAFLEGRLGFTEIPRLIESVLERHEVMSDDTLENIVAADRWARQQAAEMIDAVRG